MGRVVLLALALLLTPGLLYAQSLSVNLGNSFGPKEIGTTLSIFVLLTLLSLAPSIIITMTSFTRFIIVFSILRQALGLQAVPPNQVLVGLALFMSFIVMTPTIDSIRQNAYEPYTKNEISQREAIDVASQSLRTFMLKHTREKDLALFLGLSKKEKPATIDEVGILHIVPAFILSELKTAFQIGFMIYIPFIVIDMVVASILLAMGMMVLPPIIISMPFKLMLFVLVDGWNLIVGSLVKSFEVGV